MKTVDGHLYEAPADWHAVVVKNSGSFVEDHLYRYSWISKHTGDEDHEAWCYAEDDVRDPEHRTVFFFKDRKVAALFALRWA
jgi:hypothetical protein